MNAWVTHLECGLCGRRFEAGRVWSLCGCGGPLLVKYDPEALRRSWSREEIGEGPRSMWRYAPALPPGDPGAVVSLGEGMTPLVRARRLGAPNLWIKDEGRNPAGSVKARGLSCTVSMAVELGIGKLAMASAGNGGSALAAYAAAAGLEAHIFLPRDVPQAIYLECQAFGARVTLVDGLAGDCAPESPEWFDVSALREPYRVEGQKTLGYELAEQLGWRLPDAIVCPTGGGVGLIGMWKAFAELEALGWIPSRRPKMIVVQARGCQPVVRAFEKGERRSEFWEDPHTVATGLRVPKPLGDFLILDAVRLSGGACVAVSDEELLDAGLRLAADEGMLAAPEGAACVAARDKLLASGFLKPEEQIVLCNPAAGLKYQEAYGTRFPREAAREQDKLGGLITPR